MKLLNTRVRRCVRAGGLAAGIAILFAVSYVGYVYYREKPRVQLIQQSMANITSAIRCYIDDHGTMPGGMEDLIAAGVVTRIPPCRPIGLNDERSTTEYRLSLDWNDHELYYWNDIVVHWDVTAQTLQVHDGIMVNRSNGKPDFIIGRRDLFNQDHVVYHLNFSLILFEALSKASGAADSDG
ncbi:MAG: hypothetical protein H6818_19680 [Phycisphaerales bacterium]|nr:hypothetical protein [Phycisphaerales bacterium]MCB9863688.1 hypothetical protein [Phycisphaerales bacterium]